jgi:hypothetical protein
MGSRELMVTPRQNSLILLNIDTATSQELPETHIEPSSIYTTDSGFFSFATKQGIRG